MRKLSQGVVCFLLLLVKDYMVLHGFSSDLGKDGKKNISRSFRNYL